MMNSETINNDETDVEILNCESLLEVSSGDPNDFNLLASNLDYLDSPQILRSIQSSPSGSIIL